MTSIQNDILDDINNMYGRNLLGSSALNGLNSRVANMNKSLIDLNTVKENGLSKQNDVLNLVTSEADRLDQKKNTIDQAILSQSRLIYFNDNTRKVYASYIRILIVLVVTLAFVWVLRVIHENIPFIPDGVIDFLIIITIAAGIIIMYNYYLDIRKRSEYNFDEIKMDPPASAKDAKDAANARGDLIGGSGELCVGSECCIPATTSDAGTIWDELTGKCVYDPKKTPEPTKTAESFVSNKTMEIIFGKNTDNQVEPERKDKISNGSKGTEKPLDAFEYASYTKYK